MHPAMHTKNVCPNCDKHVKPERVDGSHHRCPICGGVYKSGNWRMRTRGEIKRAASLVRREWYEHNKHNLLEARGRYAKDVIALAKCDMLNLPDPSTLHSRYQVGAIITKAPRRLDVCPTCHKHTDKRLVLSSCPRLYKCLTCGDVTEARLWRSKTDEEVKAAYAKVRMTKLKQEKERIASGETLSVDRLGSTATTEEIARVLCCTTDKVRRLCRAGIIKATKPDGEHFAIDVESFKETFGIKK